MDSTKHNFGIILNIVITIYSLEFIEENRIFGLAAFFDDLDQKKLEWDLVVLRATISQK